MSLKVAREQFGRVKPYYQRNEILRAINAAVTGLKQLGSAAPPTDVRSALREAMQLLSRNEEIRKHVREGSLIYQPGKESILLQELTKAQRAMSQDADKEDREAALARKIKLDQCYNRGISLLTQRKASEADACFAEALNFYRDEHTIFPMMGKAMLEAGEIRRALPYLKKAQELLPNESNVRELFEMCARMRDKLKQGS